MATEVGSLSASLTLDLSGFTAGISEATSLAQQLGNQLKSLFTGDIGLKQMEAQIREAVEAIQALRAEVSNLQSSQNTSNGADLFAQMRTHTAVLPSEINNIQSALTGAVSAAQQLSAAMQAIATDATTATQALQGINATTTGTPAWDFSEPLTQLQEMSALVQQIVTGLTSLGTIDLATGEVQGGDLLISTNNILASYREIADIIIEITSLMNPLNNATKIWFNTLRRALNAFQNIASAVQQSANNIKAMKQPTNQVNNATNKAQQNAGKLSNNLQTAKGYAISIKGIIGGIIISQAFYKMLNIMTDLVDGSLEFSRNLQDAGVAFSYLMQDATVSSEAFLNALKDIALVSPLDTTDLTAASRKLMAMGFSAEATVPALQILTDTAAVFSNGAGDMSNMIDHIALAFGQMIAAGKVSSQELRQLYNAGLPVYQLLSDGLGISMEMAKNAGHYNIDSAEAVYAILMQLQEKYGGAAEALSKTMSGSMEVIRESLEQLLSYSWQPAFNSITEGLNGIAQKLQALVKITQAYGVGGLFQALFPESSWTPIRKILSGLGQIGGAIKVLFQLVGQVVSQAVSMAMNIGSVVLPIIGSLAGAIMRVVAAVVTAAPWIKTLFAAIMLLTVGMAIGKIVIFLAKAIYTLTGAKAAVAAIGKLISALLAFAVANPVVTVAIAAIAVAFLAIVASSEKAKAAIASFFGGVSDSFSNFGQSLDLGFDPDSILMPEFELPDTADFTDGLNSMISGLEDLEEAEDDAGDAAKKNKKNIQSFDEVYQIDDEDSSTSGLSDTLDDMLDAINGIGNLDYSDLFDWTGDWATDWGNLSAGLGDLETSMSDMFGNMSEWASNFWSKLANAFQENPEVAGALLGAAIGAVLGALVGHPLIGAAIGALAGYVAGLLWPSVAEFLDSVGLSSTGVLGASIGAILGAAIGSVLGNPLLGAGIGALVGWLIAEVIEGISTGDWTGVAMPIGIGLGWAIGTLLGHPLIGAAIGALVGWIADEIIEGITTGDWSGLAFPLGIGIGAAIGFVVGGPGGAAVGAAIGGLVGWIVEEIVQGVTTGDWTGLAMPVGIGIGAGIGMLVGGPGGAVIGAAVGGLVGWIVESFMTSLESGDWTLTGTLMGAGIGAGIGTIVGGPVGTVVGGAIGAVVGWLVGLITTNWDEYVVPFFTESVPNFFIGLAETIGSAFSYAWDGVYKFFTETIPTWFGDFIATLGNFFMVEVPEKISQAAYDIGYALGVILTTLFNFLFKDIPQAFADFIEALRVFFTETIPGLWEDFKQAFATFLADWLFAIVMFFTKDLPEGWLKFTTFLDTFFNETLPGLWNDFLWDLSVFFGDMLLACIEFFTTTLPNAWVDFVEGVKELGANIIDGIVKGLEDGWFKITEWIASFFKGFVDGVKDVFGIHSPAKETKPLGEYIVGGITGGMEEGTEDMLSFLNDDFKQTILSWFDNAFSASDFTAIGSRLVEGIQQGALLQMDTMESFLQQMVGAPIVERLSVKFDPMLFMLYGQNIIDGIQQGILYVMRSMSSWLITNVSNPTHSWYTSYFAAVNFYIYGENIIRGMMQGVENMRPAIMSQVSAICAEIRERIQSALDMHSPSRFTEWCGEMLMIGMSNGITENAKSAIEAASEACDKLAEALTPEEVSTNVLGDTVASSLDSLNTWSSSFIGIMSNTFDSVTGMFNSFSDKLNTAVGGIQDVPNTLNANIGSLAAVERLSPEKASSGNKNNGTEEVQRVIAQLAQESMEQLSLSVAEKLYAYLAPLFATMTDEEQQRTMLYVGTLVADDTGLKQLERKLYKIRQTETTRR